MFFFSGEFQCSEEAVTIAAMTQIQNVFVSPSGQRHASVSKTEANIYRGSYMSDHVLLDLLFNKSNKTWSLLLKTIKTRLAERRI